MLANSRMGTQSVGDGRYTEYIYSLIREQKYDDAIRSLSSESANFPNNRAVLSLLGYCYYHVQEFHYAAQMYSQLRQLFPNEERYAIYECQALMKSGEYTMASEVCSTITTSSASNSQRITLLRATEKYELQDYTSALTLLDQCDADDQEVIVFRGCIAWSEKKYDEARQLFLTAVTTTDYQADLAYNIALCYFCSKQHAQALKYIAEVIERGVRNHPEMGVGTNAKGGEVRSVGNSSVLKETALVECFNLKVAIDLMAKNYELAKESLMDMPPRAVEELDPVTLHNEALIDINNTPNEGFKKLNFLLQLEKNCLGFKQTQGGMNVHVVRKGEEKRSAEENPPFPPETFVNLLLLYCKHGYYDLAADLQAEFPHLASEQLEQDDIDFLNTLIMVQSSPEEAYRRFDDLAGKHVEKLRKKHIRDAPHNHDNIAVKEHINVFDRALAKYVPVLMGQAKICWDMENYTMVERLLRQSAEFCSENVTWKLNVAHVFFMQEKYRECIRYYEPLVKNADNLLDLAAIVLANLCVAYIMTSANEDAEELMRQLEEEEQAQLQDPSKQVYHLCIVNLVIGTLYCAKGNLEFGISRIIKSLEPYDQKLGADTWYYAKRCFLALIENLSKHMITLQDETFYEILQFLDAADQYSEVIPATVNPLQQDGKNTISFEARLIKKLFLKQRE